jgi:hypothetical protein
MKYRKLQLDPDELMREARAAAGLSNYGNMYFVKPLTEHLNRAAREVDFTEAGLEQQKSDFRRYLINRLRTQKDIERHPEILEEDVSDPIIIIGLPRSGTTKMQRMMSTDLHVQRLPAWRLMNPARFPGTKSGEPDPRLTAGGDDLLEGKRHAQLGSGHEMGPNLVDSDIALFEQSFDLGVLGMPPRIPLFHYEHWAPPEPDTEGDRQAYDYLQTVLKYLQWQDGGKRDRPWILKSIIHHAHLDTALEYFPRATFIHCQRDPLDSLPSFAKLQYAAFMTRSRSLDKDFVSRGILEYCAVGMRRYIEARDRLRLSGRIVDAKYDKIRNDVMSIIGEAYERAGLTLSREAEAAMLQWERDNEQHRHGKHSYTLEEFGFSKPMIEGAFAEFIERFVERRESCR